MNTNVFPWYNPPFDEYNIAQAAAVPFLDKDVNMVISFSTAVGKTVLAECAFAYHMEVDAGRVAYVCPYRSLASEKYELWKDGPLGKYGVVMGTGETRVGQDDFEKVRLAIVTNESFDSKTRIERWYPWLKSLKCVVFDEAHLLSESGRGSALESSIMRFTSLNPTARLILLSATMSNAMELARWIKSLNNKPTKCITSSWKPTETITKIEVEDGYEAKVVRALEIINKSIDKKVIVFVHSKVAGNDILKRLKMLKIRTAFHNASLSHTRRKKIEQVFGDKYSGLNVLVSTSTLGSGVNLA